jgi:outer membrane protein OmpA-like peptidoglycan-associated protein
MTELNRLVLALVLSLLLLSNTQIPDKTLQKGYYLVVAAYLSHQEDYAKKYSDFLNKNGTKADYGFDEERKFYYVYLHSYVSFDSSINNMLRVRGDGKFDKAWVRIIKKEEQQEVVTTDEVAQEPKGGSSSIDKKSEPAGKTVAKTEQKKENSQPVVSSEPKKEEVPSSVSEAKKTENTPVATETVVTEVVPNPQAAPVMEPQTLKSTPVFLSLYSATNNEVLDGEVEIVDAVNAKMINRVKGNDYVFLPNPKNQNGELLLISNVFGFRKEQHELNYKNTEADTLKPFVSLVGNFYVVHFALSKIHKGDISTLYNVYFYNDAAIMLPTSQYQLNSLLKLMKENPTYKIKLHGHTNGNGRGKIIYMGESKDFFTVTKDVKEGSGSAKELSEARAEVIRQWLIAQGIAENRVSVKGWGGSRMIHDKNSSHARKNIRVDVEVIEE